MRSVIEIFSTLVHKIFQMDDAPEEANPGDFKQTIKIEDLQTNPYLLCFYL